MASSITATHRSPSPIAVPGSTYRQSLLSTHSIVSSSATSYKTAPASAAASRQSLPLSTTSIGSSSAHTINPANRDADDVNDQTQVIMVTSEVEVDSGPGQETYFSRTTVVKSTTTCETVQPSDDAHFESPPPRVLGASYSDSVVRETPTTRDR